MSKSKDLTRHDAITKADENWRGYTLEELRYRRAYVAARREMEKERLAYNINSMRTNTLSTAGSALRHVGSAIPMVNYAVMAIGIGAKVFRLFKGRKKKDAGKTAAR